MACRGTNIAACRPGNRNRAAPATYKAVVDAYIADYRDEAAREMRFYARGRTLGDAIEKAALSRLPGGKRHPHQRRRSAATLSEARRRLGQVNIAAASDFAALHDLVERTIGPIDDIGPLTVYDIAHRIGAHLGHEPAQVYLHSGTRDGARALGLGGETIAMSALPPAFRRLSPAEAEDCLCIYKKELKQIQQRQIRAGK